MKSTTPVSAPASAPAPAPAPAQFGVPMSTRFGRAVKLDSTSKWPQRLLIVVLVLQLIAHVLAFPPEYWPGIIVYLAVLIPCFLVVYVWYWRKTNRDYITVNTVCRIFLMSFILMALFMVGMGIAASDRKKVGDKKFVVHNYHFTTGVLLASLGGYLLCSAALVSLDPKRNHLWGMKLAGIAPIEDTYYSGGYKVVWGFRLGFSAIFIGALDMLMHLESDTYPTAGGRAAVKAFCAAAFSEEWYKILLAGSVPLITKYRTSSYAVLTLGGISGLAFSFSENLSYVMMFSGSIASALQVAAIRAALCVPGHMICTLIATLGIVHQKEPKGVFHRIGVFLPFFILAVAFHGFYDWILMWQGAVDQYIALGIAVVITLLSIGAYLFLKRYVVVDPPVGLSSKGGQYPPMASAATIETTQFPYQSNQGFTPTDPHHHPEVIVTKDSGYPGEPRPYYAPQPQPQPQFSTYKPHFPTTSAEGSRV